mmetsp:Transcript_60062/g.143065  ORF Transcript_60062/g.143065 Transcript_60062/m.143065 type:complete len:217 (+) Transcript_60062:602-1252(+)
MQNDLAASCGGFCQSCANIGQVAINNVLDPSASARHLQRVPVTLIGKTIDKTPPKLHDILPVTIPGYLQLVQLLLHCGLWASKPRRLRNGGRHLYENLQGANTQRMDVQQLSILGCQWSDWRKPLWPKEEHDPRRDRPIPAVPTDLCELPRTVLGSPLLRIRCHTKVHQPILGDISVIAFNQYVARIHITMESMLRDVLQGGCKLSYQFPCKATRF